jgi:hypothetical protein
MLSRLFLTLAYIVGLTALCVALQPHTRMLVAAPMALLTGYLTLTFFVDASFNRTVLTWARGRLRYSTLSGGK